MSELVFKPIPRPVYELPEGLKAGDRIKVTTRYTYSHNYTQWATLIELTEYGTWLIRYDNGLNAYIGRSTYHEVRRA